jgi:threonine dehydrogenase-like Zn-dependent dehydrogenase
MPACPTVAHCPSWGSARSGDMACRIARQKWIDKIIGVDLVDGGWSERWRGIQVIDLREHEDDLLEVIRELTDGRGLDSVIDAVGMEAHDSPGAAEPLPAAADE